MLLKLRRSLSRFSLESLSSFSTGVHKNLYFNMRSEGKIPRKSPNSRPWVTSAPGSVEGQANRSQNNRPKKKKRKSVVPMGELLEKINTENHAHLISIFREINVQNYNFRNSNPDLDILSTRCHDLISAVNYPEMSSSHVCEFFFELAMLWNRMQQQNVSHLKVVEPIFELNERLVRELHYKYDRGAKTEELLKAVQSLVTIGHDRRKIYLKLAKYFTERSEMIQLETLLRIFFAFSRSNFAFNHFYDIVIERFFSSIHHLPISYLTNTLFSISRAHYRATPEMLYLVNQRISEEVVAKSSVQELQRLFSALSSMERTVTSGSSVIHTLTETYERIAYQIIGQTRFLRDYECAALSRALMTSRHLEKSLLSSICKRMINQIQSQPIEERNYLDYHSFRQFIDSLITVSRCLAFFHVSFEDFNRALCSYASVLARLMKNSRVTTEQNKFLLTRVTPIIWTLTVFQSEMVDYSNDDGNTMAPNKSRDDFELLRKTAVELLEVLSEQLGDLLPLLTKKGVLELYHSVKALEKRAEVPSRLAKQSQDYLDSLVKPVRMISAFQEDVSLCLKSIDIDHQVETTFLDLFVDILLKERTSDGRSVVIEVDGNFHHPRNEIRLLGPYLLKDQILRDFDAVVIRIPAFDWDGLDREQKQEYIRKRLESVDSNTF